MDKSKYVIIGGGAAGVAAAEAIRQIDQNGSLTIVSDEKHALYSRVMLSKPNFFLGKIPFDQVYLKGDDWYRENRINFLGGQTASSVDGVNKIISLTTGEKLPYEKLLLAIGVRARTLNVPGADKSGVHYLRTLEDGKKIMADLKTGKTAVVVGGGFISFEMADLLKLAGLDTTIILREAYFWEPILDEASGLMIENSITKNGLKIIKQAEIAEINGADSVTGVTLKNGRQLSSDLVLCGIGVINQVDWLKSAGLAVNKGILANEYLETNLPAVWVAGDIAEYKDVLLAENVQMGNWVNAREQGRIAGLNMASDQKHQFKFVSFYTTQGLGLTIAFVGDVAPGRDRLIVPRGAPALNSYARLIIVGRELVGATLINRTAELTTIAKLIENNVDVSDHHAALADPDFNLKKLLT
ncbi:MAG TPA: FAD-dependent oxidoreductase [Candidatus Paceibacterota bacterium]